MGSIATGCWNALPSLGQFVWHLTCAFSLLCSQKKKSRISSVAISRWQGLTLNTNIRLPLFWSTCSRARGPDSAAYVLDLQMGNDYICIMLCARLYVINVHAILCVEYCYIVPFCARPIINFCTFFVTSNSLKDGQWLYGSILPSVYRLARFSRCLLCSLP